LEALVDSLRVADVVHFAGNQRQPGRFLDAFDVFVLAVPEGSMSIALLEAMARGVASLITFCGPEEAIRPDETGVCGPPNDPVGLAAALAPIVQGSKTAGTAWPGGRNATCGITTPFRGSPTTSSTSMRPAGEVPSLEGCGLMPRSTHARDTAGTF